MGGVVTVGSLKNGFAIYEGLEKMADSQMILSWREIFPGTGDSKGQRLSGCWNGNLGSLWMTEGVSDGAPVRARIPLGHP
jgi:hypothetical protein